MVNTQHAKCLDVADANTWIDVLGMQMDSYFGHMYYSGWYVTSGQIYYSVYVTMVMYYSVYGNHGDVLQWYPG